MKITPREAPQKMGLIVAAVILQEGPSQDRPSNGHIVIPYIQGLGESIKKICNKYGVQTHFKGNRTLKQ